MHSSAFFYITEKFLCLLDREIQSLLHQQFNSPIFLKLQNRLYKLLLCLQDYLQLEQTRVDIFLALKNENRSFIS